MQTCTDQDDWRKRIGARLTRQRNPPSAPLAELAATESMASRAAPQMRTRQSCPHLRASCVFVADLGNPWAANCCVTDRKPNANRRQTGRPKGAAAEPTARALQATRETHRTRKHKRRLVRIAGGALCARCALVCCVLAFAGWLRAGLCCGVVSFVGLSERRYLQATRGGKPSAQAQIITYIVTL
jgi:hypothetical protein